MNNADQVTQQALSILRSGQPFQWYVIALMALVVYVYFNEAANRNWKVIAAGLALYAVHWFYEILNALIQHFTGYALWTVPTGTAFLLLIGVGVELSFMFAIAGLVFSKILPADPKLKNPGRQQPAAHCHRQRGLLRDFRALSGQDTGVRLDLPLVGRAAGVRHGLHPVFRGLDVRPRLAAPDADTRDRHAGGAGCADAGGVRGDPEVDLTDAGTLRLSSAFHQ